MKENMNLKLARTKAKMTQLQLSLNAMVSQAYISHMEKGLSVPTMAEATRIARTLGVGIDDIFPDLPTWPQRKTRQKSGK